MSDFDPDAYLAKKTVTAPVGASDFDPDAYLRRRAGEEKTGTLGAVARGAGQGLTFGFGDEIGGAIQALGAKAMGDEKSLGDLYRLNRNTFRSEDAVAEKDHPTAFMAGNVAGGLSTVPLGGARAAQLVGKALPRAGAFLAASSAARAAPTLKNLVKTGAMLGGVTGLGSSEAQDLSGVAMDTAAGAGLGAGTGLLAKGVQKAVGGVADAVVDRADRRLTKALARGREVATGKAEDIISTKTSKAGTTAQDTYRQAERIRAGKIDLTPDEEAMVKALEVESAQKARLKLPASKAAKEAAAAELSEAMSGKQGLVDTALAEELRPRVKSDARSFAKSYGEQMVGMGLGGYGGKKLDDALETDGLFSSLGTAAGFMSGRTRAGKAMLDRVRKPANQVALAKTMRKLGERIGFAEAAAPYANTIAARADAAKPTRLVRALARYFDEEDESRVAGR